MAQALIQQSTHVFEECTFSSDFDSGNLVSVDLTEEGGYDLWIGPDCAGTEQQTHSRIWFHFKVRLAAHIPTKTLTLTIRNLNSRGRMYRETYKPFYKIGDGG
jgi:hypothetical protein